MTPHGPTAATLLLAQGTGQRTVTAILGWSYSNMAEHYQHVLAELRAVAAENLGLLLWPASAIETRTETRKRAGSRPHRGLTELGDRHEPTGTQP